MAGRKQGIPAALRRARERFAAWRRTRQVGARIPEPLWMLAIDLADAHGLHRTASVLGLDYYSLKKRAGSSRGCGQRAAAAFVELSPPPLASAGECVVEFEDGLGARMRVHLKGYGAPDLASLGRSFWNAE